MVALNKAVIELDGNETGGRIGGQIGGQIQLTERQKDYKSVERGESIDSVERGERVKG